MEYLLPSEIARLVYGYLESEKCSEAANVFLSTSEHLKECYQVSLKNRKFSTKVMGFTLLKCLDQFCAVHRLVQDRIATVQANNISSYELVDQVAYLLDVGCKGHSTVMFNITVPVQDDVNRTIVESSALANKTVASTPASDTSDSVSYSVSMEGSPSKPTWCITNTTPPPPHSNQSTPFPSPSVNEGVMPIPETTSLDSLPGTVKSEKKPRNRRKEPLPVSKVIIKAIQDEKLHERIADNINKVMSTPEKERESSGGDELESVIETIVCQTQKDPYFENFLGEFFDGVKSNEDVTDKNSEKGPNGKKDSDNEKKPTKNGQKKTKSKRTKGEASKTKDDVASTAEPNSSNTAECNASRWDQNSEECCDNYSAGEMSDASSRSVLSSLNRKESKLNEAERQTSTSETSVSNQAQTTVPSASKRQTLTNVRNKSVKPCPRAIEKSVKPPSSSSSIVVLPPAYPPAAGNLPATYHPPVGCHTSAAQFMSGAPSMLPQSVGTFPAAPVFPVAPSATYSPVAAAPTNSLALPWRNQSSDPSRVFIAESVEHPPKHGIYTQDLKPGIVLSAGFQFARPFINIAPKGMTGSPVKDFSQDESLEGGCDKCISRNSSKKKRNTKSSSTNVDGEIPRKRRNPRSSSRAPRNQKLTVSASMAESFQTLVKSATSDSPLKPAEESTDCHSETTESTDDRPNSPASTVSSVNQNETCGERVSARGDTPQLDPDPVEKMSDTDNQGEQEAESLPSHRSVENDKKDESTAGVGCDPSTSEESRRIEEETFANSAEVVVAQETCESNLQPNDRCSSPEDLTKQNVMTNSTVTDDISNVADSESPECKLTSVSDVSSVTEVPVKSPDNLQVDENISKSSQVESTGSTVSVELAEKRHNSPENSLGAISSCESVNVDAISNKLPETDQSETCKNLDGASQNDEQNMFEGGITMYASTECANENPKPDDGDATEDSLPNIVFVDPCTSREVSASISVVNVKSKDGSDEQEADPRRMSMSENKISSDFKKLVSPANQNRTKKLSLSTPRNKRNHVRVLDFSTPPTQKDKLLRAAFTSPKLIFTGDDNNTVKERFRNVCRSHLFESPSMKNTHENTVKDLVPKLSKADRLETNAVWSAVQVSQSVEAEVETGNNVAVVDSQSGQNNLSGSSISCNNLVSNLVEKTEAVAPVSFTSESPDVSNVVQLPGDDSFIALKSDSDDSQRAKPKKAKNKCVNGRNVTTVSVTKSNYMKIVKKVMRKTVKSQTVGSPTKRKPQKSKGKKSPCPGKSLSLKSPDENLSPIERKAESFKSLASSAENEAWSSPEKSKLELKFKNGNVLTISKIVSKKSVVTNSSTTNSSGKIARDPSSKATSRKRTASRLSNEFPSNQHPGSSGHTAEGRSLKRINLGTARNFDNRNPDRLNVAHFSEKVPSECQASDEKMSILEAALNKPLKISHPKSPPLNLTTKSNNKKGVFTNAEVAEISGTKASSRTEAQISHENISKKQDAKNLSHEEKRLREVCRESGVSSFMLDKKEQCVSSEVRLLDASTTNQCETPVSDKISDVGVNYERSDNCKTSDTRDVFAHQDSISDTIVDRCKSSSRNLSNKLTGKHSQSQNDLSVSYDRHFSKDPDENMASFSESCSSENNLFIVTMEEEQENYSVHDTSKIEKPPPVRKKSVEIDKLDSVENNVGSQSKVCLEAAEDFSKSVGQEVSAVEREESKACDSKKDETEGSAKIEGAKGGFNQAFVCLVHDENQKLPRRFNPADFEPNERFLRNFACELEIEQEENVISLCRIAVSEEKTLLSIPSKLEQVAKTFDHSKIIKKKVYHHYKNDRTKPLPSQETNNLKHSSSVNAKHSPCFVAVPISVDSCVVRKDISKTTAQNANLVVLKKVKLDTISENESSSISTVNPRQASSSRGGNSTKSGSSQPQTTISRKVEPSKKSNPSKSSGTKSKLESKEGSLSLKPYRSEKLNKISSSVEKSSKAHHEVSKCLPRNSNLSLSNRSESSSVAKNPKLSSRQCHQSDGKDLEMRRKMLRVDYCVNRPENSAKDSRRKSRDDLDYGVLYSRGRKYEPRICDDQSNGISRSHSSKDSLKWAAGPKNTMNTATLGRNESSKRPRPKGNEPRCMEDGEISDSEQSGVSDDEIQIIAEKVGVKKYKQDLGDNT